MSAAPSPGTGASLTVLVGSLSLFSGATAVAQECVGWRCAPDDVETGAPTKIGRVHENLRRSKQRHAVHARKDGRYGDYSRFKIRLQRQTGIQWSLDASLLQQWGTPGGGSPALQFLAGLSLNVDLFDDDTVGAGSIQLSGSYAGYPTRQEGADIGSNLGVISAINDWPVNQRWFGQLTYTQALPDDRLAVALGQFPFSNFDGNRYLGDQQHNFLNLVLAQNGSSTYAAAGLGAYAQFSPTKTLHLALGMQYPNSASPETVSFPGLGDSARAWFVYGQWTPRTKGLGPAQYSLTYYQSPAVGQQPASRGWSLNAVQDLNETWTLFGRANAAYGSTTAIRSSYALGIAMNDPLGRGPTDQIGLAMGYSDPADTPTPPASARGEKIIEAYWNWTYFGGLMLTPDVQLILDPALDSGRESAWVLSLRATLMF